MKLLPLLFAMLVVPCFGQLNEQFTDVVYEKIVNAYETLEAKKIANICTEAPVIMQMHRGDEHTTTVEGRTNIEQYYNSYFEQFKSKKQVLRLTFKVVHREKVDAHIYDDGYYSLEIVTPNEPSSFEFGKFSTVLENKDNTLKISTFAISNANFIDFENAEAKQAIPTRETLLYPDFYDHLLGDYVTEDHQLIVIGRSQLRLFAYFEDTNHYRGLYKINATTWVAGKTILSEEHIQTYKFKEDKIEIYENNYLKTVATKKQLYQTQKVTFKNTQNTTLGGTLFIPANANGKAIVLVHGSGPQDRNGYASLIRLLADIFARAGVTVLTYDKQGVGQSYGNYETQNFASLAQDALSGIAYLKGNTALPLTQIGLGGSSQAGWVIAKAIQQSNAVDFVLTIGAAGSGISVIAQNIYNTETSMKCSGTLTDKQISNGITQQRYFFDYLSDQKNAAKLDQFTASIENDTTLRDWLFPTSNNIDLTNRNQWFTALEIDFNPIDVWKNYNKPVLMTFSEFDDSTPANIVKSKIDILNKSNFKSVIFLNAQHIGLQTSDVCKNDFANLTKFHDDFFPEIKKWLSSF